MIEFLAIAGAILFKPEILAGALECALRVAFSLKKDATIVVAAAEKTRLRLRRKRPRPRAKARPR